MAISLTGIAFAQSTDTIEQRTVVATGNIMPSSQSSTVHNVKIITAKTIEKQGVYNLKDLLLKENTVRISNDNLLGSSMSLQGISGQNIKILLDGVPITGRENGNIDLGQMNLNNIERIEIIEGPLSVIYGTDALGGVINMISKRIVLDSAKPYTAFANAYSESIKQNNFGAGAMLKVSGIDIGASVNRNFFGGYNPVSNSRVMLWKPKEQLFGNFTLLHQSGKLKLRFKTDWFKETIENRTEPVINHLEAYAYDEYYLTNRGITSLNLEKKIHPLAYWQVLTSFSNYQRDKVTYLKDLTQNEQMQVVQNPDANSSTTFLTAMSRGTYSNAQWSKMAYQLGYDINLNNAFGSKIEADKGKINDYAVFACAEIKAIKHFNIKPGFRASYNSQFAAPFIPSLQIKYDGIKRLSIRYAYGRGFRAPGLKEMYLYFVDFNHNILGNPDLKSELSDNHNAALKYRFKYKQWQLVLDNSYFYNNIYNQIALVRINSSTLAYTYQNVDRFKSLGTNLMLQFSKRRFSGNIGAAYTGINNNAFEWVGKQHFLYSPELRTQLFYQLKSKHFFDQTTVSVFYKYVGKTVGYALDNLRNVVNTYTQAYSMLDLTINKAFMRNRLVFTMGCKNLLNVSTIKSVNVSSSFHNAGSNTMPVSIGRSVFIQCAVKL